MVTPPTYPVLPNKNKPSGGDIMPEQRNLNEFINELNERVYALEMVQKTIVTIAGDSEEFKELFIETLKGTMT